MRLEVPSATFRAAGASLRTTPEEVTGLAPGALITAAVTIRQSTIDNRHSRRASVLVLVMTILGILFVLGVAFLATMNFEADMIVSETQRDRAESRVTAVVDQLGSTLRDGLMSDSRVPFGNPSLALSATAYAEMPGVQNSFSPIEPYRDDRGTATVSDDKVFWPWFTDLISMQNRPFQGPTLPWGANILAADFDPTKPVPLPGTMQDLTGNGDIAVVLDADGDGIADSVQVDASLLDFSDAQLAALSARLNPPSNPTGKVYVGIRVIPHGGLVNLNASHPKLIENILDIPDIFSNDDPDYGYFKHRPTRNQVSYSPLLEERSLRRRVFLPPFTLPPSWLHGDPFSDLRNAGADMLSQMFAPLPRNAADADRCDQDPYAANFDRCYRYRSIVPEEKFTSDPDSPPLWAVRMEPFTADGADGFTDGIMPEYDRRHLVTTISHDDLLTRGGRVPNPDVPGGEEDILTKMTQANQTERDPDVDCPALLPFEYVDYPQTILDCCPADLGCRLNARKGRLQLSLPFLDDRIDAANAIANPADRQAAFDRIFRLIHDTFFLLVRNAAHVTTLEGTPCVKRCLGGTNQGTLCNLTVECPGSICESLDCLYANGACGNNGKCTVAAVPPTAPPTPFLECASVADCSIPGSVCRADGVCTIHAPYWQDRPCTADNDCLGGQGGGEFCDLTLPNPVCLDAWTHQTHSQALISRTAAALTANFLDYTDFDDTPTRVAVRSLDLAPGMCITGTNIGRTCDINADCGPTGLCSPPQRVCVTTKYRTPLDKAAGGLKGRFPIAPIIECVSNADCPAGASCAFGTSRFAGREFDLGGVPDILQPTYVYGLERQPYITEVATYAEVVGATPQLTGWAVELFNPYDTPINTLISATDQYYLVEVGGTGVVHEIALNATLQPNSGATPNPFTVFITANNPAARNGLLGTPFIGVSHDLTGADALTFTNGSTIYLVRRVLYPPDTTPTNIVVDQFDVPATSNVGNVTITDDCTAGCVFSRQRIVQAPSPWTATVPRTTDPAISGPTTLGTWNDAPDDKMYPVEVNFADLGSFTRPFNNPTNQNDPRNGSVSFPTTGSLLMLIRHANRSFPAPGEPIVKELAFTTRLIGNTIIPAPANVTISAEQQIDNGRMPVFDQPELGTDNNWYSAHHLSASTTQLGAPGNLDTLPWGQLVFDYFTALPLSNPGPYFVPDKDEVAAPDSLPRVDLDGLRVHGRININAAPWKVLAGLPFVPVQRIPIAFRDRIATLLGIAPTEYDDAVPIGNELAHAIVAYRDLRPILGSGDYNDGSPAPGFTGMPPAYARGWNPTIPGSPPTPIPLMARRGTGLMTVGELANVRHLGAASGLYRIDSGVIDVVPDNNNTENFIDAVAGLVALGDWVTVRSQVFTVYGVLRGEEDPAIVDPDPSTPPSLAELRARDADSRAMRFQETIDRLPTFLGEPMPSRIGGRTLSRYSDVRND